MIATARADASKLLLFISSTIATDRIATQAAAKFVSSTPSIKALIHTEVLDSNIDKLPATGLVLAPILQWQQTLPSLAVLRLPFFYPDLASVHSALDGKLGKRLAQIAETNGWKLLAVWDDGMTDFSGNQPYGKLLNLRGKEFAIWQSDPLQEMELKSLNVWSRVIRQNGVQRNAQQCIVDSRSTTPAQMWREHLQRVHLDMTLTHDRYEGYVLAIPYRLWQAFTQSQRDNLMSSLGEVTTWERNHAEKEQQQALADLRKAGMTLHELDAKQRQLFTSRMPSWDHFLVKLDARTATDLITAARMTVTAATGRRSGTNEKALTDSLPTTQATQKKHEID